MTQSPVVSPAPSTGCSSVPVQLSRSPLFQKEPLARESCLGASFLGVACLTEVLGDASPFLGGHHCKRWLEEALSLWGTSTPSLWDEASFRVEPTVWVFLIKDRMWPHVGGAGDSMAIGLVRPGPCEQGPFSSDNEPGTDLSHPRPFLPSVRDQLWPPSRPPVHG